MQHRVCENFFAAIPEEPEALVMTWRHLERASTAFSKLSLSSVSSTSATAFCSITSEFFAISKAFSVICIHTFLSFPVTRQDHLHAALFKLCDKLVRGAGVGDEIFHAVDRRDRAQGDTADLGEIQRCNDGARL